VGRTAAKEKFPDIPYFDVRFASVWTLWDEKITILNKEELAAAALSRKPIKVEKKFKTELNELARVDHIGPFWHLFVTHWQSQSFPKLQDTHHLMRDGIQPRWEDPANVRGGRFTFRMPKNQAWRLFTVLVAECVGGELQMKCCTNPGDSICGVTISARPTDDLIIIWNANKGNDSLERVMHNGAETFQWIAHFIDYVKALVPHNTTAPISAFYKPNAAHKEFHL
jgi:hypothetical protein